tara:strand:- start:2074 stop:2427 length:354 start_codon:yes stop_codon:yes gene_type:complete
MLTFREPVFGPFQMVIAVALLLIGLFVYAGFQTAVQNHRLQLQERVLRDDIAQQQQQRAKLEGLSSYINSDEYIEAIARTEFGLVLPGEVAIVVEAPVVPLADRAPGERWWEPLVGD